MSGPSITSPEPARPMNLLWLVLIGAALPSAIALVNYALLGRMINSSAMRPEICLQFGWYVAQVGIVGYVVGRGIDGPLLRWLVFGWILLLVNVLTCTLAAGPRVGSHVAVAMPPAALFAGQIGLCIVWAILGTGHWTVRLILALLTGGGLFGLWISLSELAGRDLWSEMLALHIVNVAALCAIMHATGFRLRRLTSVEGQTPETGRPFLQFGIKHVLIGMTLLAILLGIARALDLLNRHAVEQAWKSDITFKVVVANASAIVILVSLWGALGKGHWIVRALFGLATVLLLGIALASWSAQHTTALPLSVRQTGDYLDAEWRFRRLHKVGLWWLGWLFLSGGLLAATLIILRTIGYRLVRVQAKET